MKDKRVVMLAGPGESTHIVYHALAADFNVVGVILEQPVDKATFLKRRVKNLGLPTVVGQVLFMATVGKALQASAQARMQQIKQESGLNDADIPADKLINVDSINSPEAIAALQRLQPDVVVVNGTRIISKKVLSSVPCPFINTHAGINPLYRGVHGGYWALVNKDTENCGVTVHLVDTGIDTGNILYQAHIKPTEEDNFATYPLLQLQAGLPWLKRAVLDVFEGTLMVKKAPEGNSRLWSHPTLWGYLSNRLGKGVK